MTRSAVAVRRGLSASASDEYESVVVTGPPPRHPIRPHTPQQRILLVESLPRERQGWPDCPQSVTTRSRLLRLMGLAYRRAFHFYRPSRARNTPACLA